MNLRATRAPKDSWPTCLEKPPPLWLIHSCGLQGGTQADTWQSSMLQQLQHTTFLKMRMFRKFNSTFCFKDLQWAPGLSYGISPHGQRPLPWISLLSRTWSYKKAPSGAFPVHTEAETPARPSEVTVPLGQPTNAARLMATRCASKGSKSFRSHTGTVWDRHWTSNLCTCSSDRRNHLATADWRSC